MKYFILSAMKEEITSTIEFYNAQKIDMVNGQEIYEYSDSKNTYYFTNSGIGKINAAITTTLLIERYAPDLILSVGTSGGINSKLSIGDLVVADKMVFHDVDVTAFGYELGQLPGEETYIKVLDGTKFFDYISNKVSNVKMGTIATGDKFISDKNISIELESKFDNLYAVEMESASILLTSKHLNTNCLIVRGISDLAHSESTIEFDQYIDIVSKKFQVLVEHIDTFNEQ